MVKKGEEKSGIIKRADAGAAAKAYKVLVESNYSGPHPYIRILNTSCSFRLCKAENTSIWGGALLGSKYREIEDSYVQARQSIDFHILHPE